MTMEINGIRSDYISQYPKSNKVEEKKENSIPDKDNSRDEYISSKKEEKKSIGLYALTKDENGNPKIDYDDPQKNKNASSKVKPVADGDKAKKYTINTDAVDREIKMLKEEKKQIQNQIQRESGDEKKTNDLKQKLAKIEMELSQKDNDSYRRQNAKSSSEIIRNL